MDDIKRRIRRVLPCLLIFSFVSGTAFSTGETVAATKKVVKKIEVTNVQKKKISLERSKSFQLVAKVTLKKGKKASKKVTYRSNNKSVATVSKKGVVRAQKVGKTTITVTSCADKKKEIKIWVQVTAPIVGVDSVSICKEYVTMHLPYDDPDDFDEEDYNLEEDIIYVREQLKATVLPTDATNKKLKWESSNPQVASVNQDGIVTAENEGTAVITVCSTDGSGKSDRCTVTVIQDGPKDKKQ